MTQLDHNDRTKIQKTRQQKPFCECRRWRHRHRSKHIALDLPGGDYEGGATLVVLSDLRYVSHFSSHSRRNMCCYADPRPVLCFDPVHCHIPERAALDLISFLPGNSFSDLRMCRSPSYCHRWSRHMLRTRHRSSASPGMELPPQVVLSGDAPLSMCLDFSCHRLISPQI